MLGLSEPGHSAYPGRKGHPTLQRGVDQALSQSCAVLPPSTVV